MKSPFYFIVKPFNDKRYDNTKKIGNIDLITSTSKEDHTASNRNAIVVETPINYTGPINIGDTLLVHHNVFKYYNDMKGREKSGKSFFKDDLFFIEFDQFFMYKNKDGWHSHSKYCMIKPIPKKNFYLKTHQDEEPLMGIVKYSNKYLNSQGIKEGDKVSFQPDSEYEFKVNNEKLYRMFDSNITLVL
tara:strand:+ start:1382 stop:1945 length:564 start_codon:yes stop_codon:yes gene_type:complete